MTEIDEFEKQALALAETKNLACEGAVNDGAGWRLMRFDLGICPINVDLWDPEKKCKEGMCAALKLALLPDEGDIFTDEDEYYRETAHVSHLAAEAIVPCGTFSPQRDPDFRETPTVMLNAKVESVEKVVLDGEDTLKIKLRMQEFTFDAFFPDGVLPYAEKGNVIATTYALIGVLAGDAEVQ